MIVETGMNTEDTEDTEDMKKEGVRIQYPQNSFFLGSVSSVFSLLILLTLFNLGCAGTAQMVRSYPAPSAEELLQSVRARQAAVRGINVETRATSWLGGERVRGTVQMLVERSGRLRFEAEVSLQGTVAALTVDGGQFAFIDHQKHLFRRGPACPANVAAHAMPN